MLVPHNQSITDGSHLLTGTSLQILSLVSELKWAFDCMSPFKSPGEDGIFPALLQKGIIYLSNPIKCIYQASLALGYIPMACRIARVAFIPKTGKIDYTMAKSFRPIMLCRTDIFCSTDIFIVLSIQQPGK